MTNTKMCNCEGKIVVNHSRVKKKKLRVEVINNDHKNFEAGFSLKLVSLEF